jgi:hypothetical protein
MMDRTFSAGLNAIVVEKAIGCRSAASSASTSPSRAWAAGATTTHSAHTLTRWS